MFARTYTNTSSKDLPKQAKKTALRIDEAQSPLALVIEPQEAAERKPRRLLLFNDIKRFSEYRFIPH